MRTIIFFFLLCSSAWAQNENEWTRTLVTDDLRLAQTLPNGRQCDLESDDHVIEVDWEDKALYEGIGQALYYSVMYNKDPGLLILVKSQKFQFDDVMVTVGMLRTRGFNFRLIVFDTRSGKYVYDSVHRK